MTSGSSSDSSEVPNKSRILIVWWEFWYHWWNVAINFNLLIARVNNAIMCPAQECFYVPELHLRLISIASWACLGCAALKPGHNW